MWFFNLKKKNLVLAILSLKQKGKWNLQSKIIRLFLFSAQLIYQLNFGKKFFVLLSVLKDHLVSYAELFCTDRVQIKLMYKWVDFLYFVSWSRKFYAEFGIPFSYQQSQSPLKSFSGNISSYVARHLIVNFFPFCDLLKS